MQKSFHIFENIIKSDLSQLINEHNFLYVSCLALNSTTVIILISMQTFAKFRGANSNTKNSPQLCCLKHKPSKYSVWLDQFLLIFTCNSLICNGCVDIFTKSISLGKSRSRIFDQIKGPQLSKRGQ